MVYFITSYDIFIITIEIQILRLCIWSQVFELWGAAGEGRTKESMADM